MKNVLHLVTVLLITVQLNSQEKNVETESVTLDNLITFIVEHYKTNKDSLQSKNTTFLLETYSNTFNSEDKVILKQAFKLLSKRSSKNDKISIVTYSNYSGIALKQVKVNDLKKILHTIENLKSSVKIFEEDGIELAYNFTKENFIESSENLVVMVRIPHRSSDNQITNNPNIKSTKKAKSNTVVLTAIALLPEIISVIKN